VGMNVSNICYGMFIDLAGCVYCSMRDSHRVIKNIFVNSINTTIVGGTGCAGNQSNALTLPQGIFVDINFDLYVADTGNHRIQRFAFNRSNATTVAGRGISNQIILNGPRGIVLDGSGYLFITDTNNHRLLMLSPFGFRCIAGCSGQPGTQPHQLNYPQMMSFDSQGNIYVADRSSFRIQKFRLVNNQCGKCLVTLLIGYHFHAFSRQKDHRPSL
jgi:DNA-binding beta-propeller fold protein YncE